MDFRKSPKTDFGPVDRLSREEAKEEIDALREGIEHHNFLYYVKNSPEISDALFDRLFRRLQELEAAFPEFDSGLSPTRRVGGAPASELAKVPHTAPMLSLNSAIDEKDIRDFFDFIRRESGKENHTWVAEPKFDGISVEIVYEEGRFARGATRGDGRTGEDITANLKTVRSLPFRLRSDRTPSFLAVQGEIFLPRQAFQEFNRKRVENGEEPFANPRNAAAGTIRRLDPRIVAEWPLDIFFYEILRVEGEAFATHWQELERFRDLGLKTDPANQRCGNFREIGDYHRELAEKREALPYEIDGIVLKLDDLKLREELGTRHRSPRWAMAWKFPPREEVTTLERIVVQVGTSGILTPVALLEPVDVGGVTVSRATLHNEREVAEKDLREGDTVRIARAGDVIPEVVEWIERPDKGAKKFGMPEKCPSCGTRVVREGAYVRCPAGLSCPAQLRGRIIHYGSRSALDIAGLGAETALQLVERGLVGGLADLYRLTEEDLRHLEGFAEKSAHQLYQAIQGAKKPRLDRFLYALAIRHVGQKVAHELARSFPNLENLQNAGREHLQSISSIGPEIAGSVMSFFAENEKALWELAEAGVEVQRIPGGKGKHPLEGKTFVFSGSLENYSRDEAKKRVEDLGARATSSVSGNTDFLVVGENPGSKLEEAKALKVRILDEKAFEKLLSESE
jgi:DNA ligase (NAD+)